MTDDDPYDAVLNSEMTGNITVLDKAGTKVRKVLVKTSGKTLVEQHHRTEVKKMVADIERRGLLRASTKFEGEFDDYPDYDFQEAQFMIAKAKSMFESMPSGVRKRFKNDPGEFMNFINNPDNIEESVKMGLRTGYDFKDINGNATGVTVTVDEAENEIVSPPAKA